MMLIGPTTITFIPITSALKISDPHQLFGIHQITPAKKCKNNFKLMLIKNKKANTNIWTTRPAYLCLMCLFKNTRIKSK
jgi:hypothetical protein